MATPESDGDESVKLIAAPTTAIDAQTEEDPKAARRKRIMKWFRRLTYAFVWAIILLNLFWPDVLHSGLRYIIPSQIFDEISGRTIYLYLLLFLSILLVFKIHRIIFWAFGFLMLPFYLILIFIPRTTYRATRGLLAVFLGTAAGLKSIRFRLVAWTISIIALTIILREDSVFLITLAIWILMLQMLSHFIRKFRSIARPIILIDRAREFLFSSWEKLKRDTYLKNVHEWKAMNPEDEKFSAKKSEALTGLWLANRLFIRLAKFLKRTEGGRALAIYFIISTTYTFVLTIMVFALAYFGLSNINGASIVGLENSNFFYYIYFSFMTLIGQNFGDIVPATGWAKLLVSLETLSGIIIGVILFFIFTTVIMERYKKGMDALIEKLFQEGRAIGSIMQVEFEKGLRELVEEITSNQAQNNKFFKLDDDELLEG